MKNINRRSFINKSAMGLGGAMALSNIPNLLRAAHTVKMPLGFQSFPIRDMMGKDFLGTLKTMAGFGYKFVEMCSPVGYKDIGFGFAAKMTTADIKKTIHDSGLDCHSCHFGKAELTPEKIDASIQFAHDLGLTQMICSTFWLPKTATLKDYYDDADKLNKAAEKIKAAGMVTGFHNHDMEFVMLEGQLIYDALMSHFDASLIKMQFQTEVIQLGYKASTYFNKYPGRFISSHLSDWTADKKQVPVGQGIIDWKEFFAAAKTGGVKNIFVEMDFNTFEASAKYLKSL